MHLTGMATEHVNWPLTFLVDTVDGPVEVRLRIEMETQLQNCLAEMGADQDDIENISDKMRTREWISNYFREEKTTQQELKLILSQVGLTAWLQRHHANRGDSDRYREMWEALLTRALATMRSRDSSWTRRAAG